MSIPPNTPDPRPSLLDAKGLPASVDTASSRLTQCGDIYVEQRGKRKRKFVPCLCSCGTAVNVEYYQFLYGNTKSCGCLARDAASENGKKYGFKRTHGESTHAGNTTEYKIWSGIIQRCFNENDAAFKYYGGRGITMCDRWRTSFQDFLQDVGRRPSREYSLDRFPNNDGDYEPGNVRWATDEEQVRNSRASKRIEFRGVVRNVAEWAEATGLPVSALYLRLNKGWPIDKALTQPLKITKRTRIRP